MSDLTRLRNNPAWWRFHRDIGRHNLHISQDVWLDGRWQSHLCRMEGRVRVHVATGYGPTVPQALADALPAYPSGRLALLTLLMEEIPWTSMR